MVAALHSNTYSHNAKKQEKAMKFNKPSNAVSVYYPDRDSPVKYEIELSESGAKKGMAIGLLIASRVPHPLSIPVGVVCGGVLGAIFGKAD